MTAHTFTNLSFEEPDPLLLGVPNGWAWVHRVTAFKIAAFGPSFSRFETFRGGWTDGASALTSANTEKLVFTSSDPLPKTREDFERNWNNDQHQTELGNAVAMQVTGAAAPHGWEDFEHGWMGNGLYFTAFTLAMLRAATFDGEPFDTLEHGWRSNEAYLFAFVPANLTSALFDGAFANAFDAFERVKLDVTFSWDTTGQRAVSPGHGFVEGDLVTLYAASDGLSALPNGLVPSRRYRVHAPDYSGFLLQDETGTVAVTASTPGTGSIFVKADTRTHWTTSMDD